MIVQGIEITDDVVERVLAPLRKKDAFTTDELQSACAAAGMTRVDYLAERVADRILARLKKAAEVRMAQRSVWLWQSRSSAWTDTPTPSAEAEGQSIREASLRTALDRAYAVLCSGKPPHSARECNARRILRQEREDHDKALSALEAEG